MLKHVKQTFKIEVLHFVLPYVDVLTREYFLRGGIMLSESNCCIVGHKSLLVYILASLYSWPLHLSICNICKEK